MARIANTPATMNRLGAILATSIVLAVVGAIGAWVVGSPVPALLGGLAGAGLLGLAVAWGSADPASQLFARVVTRGPASSGAVALTFDDGPDPDSTPRILAALAEAEARATFFVVVERALAHPDLVRAMADASHQVEVHGWDHSPWLTIRGPRAVGAELLRARDALAELIGRRPTRYRPPYGAVSPRLYAGVDRAGLDTIWCSIRTLDGVGMDPDVLRQRVQRAGAGDIVLLHEGTRGAPEALPRILSDLRERGLRAVTVDELLAAEAV